MLTLRSLVALLLVSSVAGAAFVPAHKSQQVSTSSALQFGFLKELGLEKPAWLPDFGGKKEEEKPAAEATDEEESTEEAAAEE